MPPIETAADLYREMKSRGLHLRESEGRDNSLYDEIRKKLGCGDAGLQSFLDSSDISAEQFMRAFLEAAAPFAKMFQEIWQYLGQRCATEADEKISVRFGHGGDPCEVDLEQFRLCVEKAERVSTFREINYWSPEALNALFDLGEDIAHTNSIRKHHSEHYRPGTAYNLPVLHSAGHPFDYAAQRVRKVLQDIISTSKREAERDANRSQIPELTGEVGRERQAIEDLAYTITDLLPTWYGIFSDFGRIEPDAKYRAFELYEEHVLPKLKSKQEEIDVPLQELLDILELPFWKYRWRTYEVWANVLTLRSLDEYNPIPRIEDGYLPLDSYSEATIAYITAHARPEACIVVQGQTPFEGPNREAIQPDLRICYENTGSEEDTAGVVEYKQRANPTKSHLEEVADAYSKGNSNSSGVVIINYDAPGRSPKLPADAYYLEAVRPDNHKVIDQFASKMKNILEDAELKPVRTTVLLDVSGSMDKRYRNSDAQQALRDIVVAPHIRVLRFNDGLVSGGDLDDEAIRDLSTRGGTQLGKAISEMERQIGLPNKLLIVTDGEHDQPGRKLVQIPEVRQCMPSKIGEHGEWLGLTRAVLPPQE